MLQSEDKKITILVGSDPSKVIFHPADWSMINMPVCPNDAKSISKHLYNTPTNRHLCLITTRALRTRRLQVLSNLHEFDRKWKFMDAISILYQKPNSCSASGLLPKAESAYLVYKGSAPDVSNTAWFSDDGPNATNFWDVAPQPEEFGVFKNIHFHRFSWEVQIIMMSMAGVLEHRSFIYTIPVKNKEIISIYEFCKKFNLTAQLFASSLEAGQKIIKRYNDNLKKDL